MGGPGRPERGPRPRREGRRVPAVLGGGAKPLCAAGPGLGCPRPRPALAWAPAGPRPQAEVGWRGAVPWAGTTLLRSQSLASGVE